MGSHRSALADSWNLESGGAGSVGEESGLALTRGHRRRRRTALETMVQRNQQFGAAVRKARGALNAVAGPGAAVRCRNWRAVWDEDR